MKAHPLFVPDLDRLRRKLAQPPPLLAKLYRRFQDRLATDATFRRYHIFLPALLGDAAAISDAKAIISDEAHDPLLLAANQSPVSKVSAQESLDCHIWCVAPRAMRLATYFTWIDAHSAWTPEERRTVSADIVGFFYQYVIPVLRARVPAGHNQQLSMTFCSAVVGHAFAGVPEVAVRAEALKAYALPKLRQTLGMMSRSGYSGEGSTYQSVVVSSLVMWVGVFLDQLGETNVWSRKWEPNGSSLADTLRMEASLGSSGGLLPPWDHYGWQRLINLAARTLWADLSDQHHLLAAAEAAWAEESFIAWRPDDRLWALIYWPEEENSEQREENSDTTEIQTEARTDSSGTVDCSLSTVHSFASPILSGWSIPSVGAAIEHLPKRLRVMMAWDLCSGGLQGICRAHANPNHLMIEMSGEPVTADGVDDGSLPLFSEASVARTLGSLSETEQQMVALQYGSLDKWVRGSQPGFLGASCAIVVDDWDAYFPRGGRQGRLVFEQRTPDHRTFAAESAAYYQPAFDVTRMRRTVSVDAAGLVWVVDDIEADSPHRFTWRAWLRRSLRADGPSRLRLELSSGAVMTLAWLGESDEGSTVAPATLTVMPTFPCRRHGLVWPDEGSVRCDLALTGRRVRFVTCLASHAADGLQVNRIAANAWETTWAGGSCAFAMPAGLVNVLRNKLCSEPDSVEQESPSDLDETPFALLDEADAVLLTALDQAPRAGWRRTTAAMQTLVMRGNQAALPKITALLQDAQQNYTVHSVAAWCLGHARYLPALDTLRRMANIPEDNTALRSRWAADRMEKCKEALTDE